MACSNALKDENFFNEINKFIVSAEKLDNSSELNVYDESCKLVLNNYSGIQTNSICQKFQHLYMTLTKQGSSGTQLNDKDYGFINFWLYYALRDLTYNNPGIVNIFVEDMIKNETKIKDNTTLQNNICPINDDIYKKLDIIYTLYYNYNKIYNSQNQIICNNPLCEVYKKECLEKYKQGIYQCPKNDNKFCEQINILKGKYEAKKDAISTSGITLPELNELPTYEQVVEEFKLIEMKKNIFIGVISTLVAVFGLVIYLFYAKKINPNGKRFLDKKNKKREIKDNINQEAHQMLYKSEENKINGNSKEYNILYNS